ncbi:MAG: hypothetical protein IJO38_10470 [Akkermansia sp.]|nr:hypothetical protein [Akkermansia sp.]
MNELPPCVLPRRRLVRRFLAVCLVLQVVGLCIGCARFDKFNSDWEVFAASVAEFSLMSLPYLLLLVPCRTSSISLVQVAGLVFPLGTALWACLGCWTSRVEDSVAALAYVMGMGLFMVGFIYAYPVMFVLGMLAHQWRNRRKRMP